MKLPDTWKPVIHLLDLGEYHADYAGQTIPVCVNPTRTMMNERSNLLVEYATRFASYNKYNEMAQNGIKLSDEQRQEMNASLPEALAWFDTTYAPAMNEWFAKLFSYKDGETCTAEELQNLRELDEHLVNWIMARAITMISEHASGRKKNSKPH